MEEGGQGSLEYIIMIALVLAALGLMIKILPGKPSASTEKAKRAYNITNTSFETILNEAK